MINLLLGFIIPLIGTTLGSVMVFFMRNTINIKIEKFLLGLSGGIMIAASIWSLLIPAITQSESMGFSKWIPATVGLILGLIFLVFTRNIFSNHQNISINNIALPKDKVLLIFAVTLHNIPEGLAVGVALAGAYFGSASITMTSALMLALGIGIQNIPEGAIISMPLKSIGMPKGKSFLIGTLSGVVEPIAAVIAFFLTGFISAILPYMLAFAAGAMIFVVIREIVPESQEGGLENFATIGFFVGFIIMMVLDITLG